MTFVKKYENFKILRNSQKRFVIVFIIDKGTSWHMWHVWVPYSPPGLTLEFCGPLANELLQQGCWASDYIQGWVSRKFPRQHFRKSF